MAAKKKAKPKAPEATPRTPSGTLFSNTLTISAGSSLSPAINLQGVEAVFVVMPPNWDAAARVITFQASPFGVNFYDVFNAQGQEIAITVTPGVGYEVTGVNNWAGFMKIRSGTRSNPVNQSADRVFTIITMTP